jgi:hypothetical protein
VAGSFDDLSYIVFGLMLVSQGIFDDEGLFKLFGGLAGYG